MDLRPAAIAWGAVVAVALAVDVELERRNLDRRRHGVEELGLLSDAARTVPGWVAVGLVVGHFAGILGRADPFRLVGAAARAAHRLLDRIGRWATAGAHVP